MIHSMSFIIQKVLTHIQMRSFLLICLLLVTCFGQQPIPMPENNQENVASPQPIEVQPIPVIPSIQIETNNPSTQVHPTGQETLNAGIEENENIGKQSTNDNAQPNQESLENLSNEGNAQNVGQSNTQSENNPSSRQEQQRIMQIKRRQKQYEEQRARQSQPAPEQKEQVQMSRHDQVRLEEREKFVGVIGQDDQTVPKKTVLFEIDRQIQQFVMKPLHNGTLTIKMLIYTLEDNAYGFVKDIEISKALKIYIYEDNLRIVGQAEFYFEKAITFKVKGGSTYVLRFYNDGLTKLISFTYPSLLESSHVENLYSKQHGQYHLDKVNILGIRVSETAQRLRRNSFMDKITNETIIRFLRSYSMYELVEIGIVMILTVLQVQILKKLFTSESIV